MTAAPQGPSAPAARLAAHMAARGLSQAAAAKLLGIGASTLSQYLSGTYPGDTARLDRVATQVLAREAEARGAVRLPRTETRTLLRIHDALRQCHAERALGVVYGPSGVGKTFALRDYCARTEGAVLLEAAPDWTPRVLFGTLADALGQPPARRDSAHDLFDVCARRLRGSARLVVVDEAEHLPYRGLELLRRLHDLSGCGLVLAGMPRLKQNLQGRQADYAQLYTRVAVAVHATPPDEPEVALLVRGALPEAPDAAVAAVALAARVADEPCTRLIERLVGQAARIAALNGVPVSEATIASAARLLLN